MTEELLTSIPLEALKEEVQRREREKVDNLLHSLPEDILSNKIEEKEKSEFQELHDQMFPGVSGEYDYFYPTWKESRETQVRDSLNNRNKKMTLSGSFYPSMTGGK